MWCHALTRLQCTLLFQTSCLRVDKHTRAVQGRTVTYTFFFNTHAMPCAHALAMHSAVPSQLFAFRTAQPCSAVKNCDIHILLQHSCDAMRLRACNALWRSKLAACACNSTIVQRVQEHNRAVQWRNVTLWPTHSSSTPMWCSARPHLRTVLFRTGCLLFEMPRRRDTEPAAQ